MKNININICLTINGKDIVSQYSIPHEEEDVIKQETPIEEGDDYMAIREAIGLPFNITNHFISSYKKRGEGFSPNQIRNDVEQAVKGDYVYNHPTKHTYLIYGDTFIYVYDPTNGSLVTMYKGTMMQNLKKISKKNNNILKGAFYLSKK